MKRISTLVVALGIASLVVAAAADASARGKSRGKQGKGSGPGPGRVMKQLELSADQQKQAIRLRAAMQEELVEIKEQMRAKHEEMRLLWAADEPDEAAIVAKHDEIAPLHRQLMLRRIKFRLAVREILTPEQKQKLTNLIKKGRPGFGHGPGGPGGPGGPWGE